MKITVDSSEPLEDALRVLGAMYRVTLVISEEEHDENPPATQARKATGKTTTARKRRGVEERPTRAAAHDDDQSQPDTKTRSGNSVTNAEVRSWARENGFTVSDRGRVPASVMAAYRRAHDQ